MIKNPNKAHLPIRNSKMFPTKEENPFSEKLTLFKKGKKGVWLR